MISRTSPAASTRALDLGIAKNLTRVGFTQADDADGIGRLSKAKDMQALGKKAERNVARLSIVPPTIDHDKG